MKILINNKIYVQKNDIAYLNSTDIPIPASIFLKVYGKGVTIIDGSNRYEFIEFSDPKEMSFFQGLDWIIDYDEVKCLSEEELIQLGQTVAAEKNRKADEFNGKSQKYRRENYERTMAEQELYDFKMYSIRDMIMFKKGELDFPLPKGVARPTEVIDSEVVTEEQKEQSSPKSFFKSIFRRNKK